MRREEAAQKYRKESEELQHIEHLLRGLHDKVKALHERLRQLYDEKESLDGETETVTPGKRSFSQLLSFHSQWVSNAALKKARIAEVEKEIKTLVYSCDESRKVIHLLERRLEAAKRGPMHPIFELDAQIAAKLSLVDDHSKKYKGMIEEIIQNVAISKLGAVAYDENDVPYVTKKGIVALLSHHKLITESKELKHQMEQFFFSRP